MYLSYYKLNLSSSFNLLIPISPINIPTLNIYTLFKFSTIKYLLQSTTSPPFFSIDNTPNSFIYIYI